MSFQNELENYINNMTEDEVKETLMDFVLVLSNTHKDKKEKHDTIVEIYEKRFKSLID